MGKAISKLKKNSRGKSENESGAALTYDDTSDFDEDSGSSASWVTTLPSRNSTMSCPTDESSSNEPTTENITEESGVTPSNQSYAEASSAKTSSPAPTLLSSELLTELTKLAREGTASAPPPTPEKASTNPFTPSTITEDESYSTSVSQSTCRSSNTSADYSALRAIDYNSQPGEARMHDSDFEWIEAVEGFLTEEVIRRSVVPTRPPVFAIRGRKPTPYGQNYRTLYRNMLNKQGNKEV